MYVLSVYLANGPVSKKFANKEISRTIEIRGDQTLEQLRRAIFDAYDRWEQHFYEFQFGKRPFDPDGPAYGTPDPPGQVVEFANTQFLYEDAGLVVTAQSGAINQQGRSFVHGFEIHLERATLLFEVAVFNGMPKRIMPLTVLNQSGKVLRPKLGASDELGHFVAEIKEVVRCIQRGRVSEILDGNLASDALALCQKQAESVVIGRPVKIEST